MLGRDLVTAGAIAVPAHARKAQATSPQARQSGPLARVLSNLQQHHGPRVSKPRERFRFAFESQGRLVVARELFVNNLDSNRPIEASVLGPEHGPHAAMTNLFLEDEERPDFASRCPVRR